MIVLFIGDVMGKPGRRIIKERLPEIRRKTGAELVIANGENATEGFGIVPAQIGELCASGVDIVTMGDHVWDRREIAGIIDSELRLLRPLNYPGNVPGRGLAVVRTSGGLKAGIINVQGRVFMQKQVLDDPFRAADMAIESLKRETPVVLVEIHAEATSEKQALAWHLAGRVGAVVGTHTHVQTADERILPGGTAYITDAGMTGPVDSVIGMRPEISIARFLTQTPGKWQVADGPVELCGVLIEIDEKTGLALSIERVRERVEFPPAAGE